MGRDEFDTVEARSHSTAGCAIGTPTANLGMSVIMEFDQEPSHISPHINTLQLKAILVVDDDKQLASALQWILADENFLVDIAFDGEEAMLKVKAHEYDAVICDLKMPKLRGDEFYLKAKQARPSLADRFIFITGFAADPNIALFFNHHQVKYLVKPFAIQVLISCVKELLC
jgi:DNA-binding NtrC family response regulator